MEGGTTGPIHFLNLEYFFRLLYESRLGVAAEGAAQPTFWVRIAEWFAHVWSVLGLVSFFFSLFAFIILAYSTVRLYQIKEAEEHDRWSDLDPAIAEREKDKSRWAHIQELIESAHEQDWKEVISEADIMLEDALADRGYAGETTAERIEKVDPHEYPSIALAKEAHQLRSEMALGGESYQLDDNIAYRTIKKYETVFKELGEP